MGWGRLWKTSKIATLAELMMGSACFPHQRKPQVQTGTRKGPGACSLEITNRPLPELPLLIAGLQSPPGASVSSLKKKWQLFGPPRAPGFCLLHLNIHRIGQDNQPTCELSRTFCDSPQLQQEVKLLSDQSSSPITGLTAPQPAVHSLLSTAWP